MTGTTIQIHCNFCGEQFVPNDRSVRCCSPQCGNSLSQHWSSLQRFKWTHPRRMFLTEVRSRMGYWVSAVWLTQVIYDRSDADAEIALYHVVCRLKQAASLFGLRIEVKRSTYKGKATIQSYRMIQDMVLPGDTREDQAS